MMGGYGAGGYGGSWLPMGMWLVGLLVVVGIVVLVVWLVRSSGH